MTPDICMTNQLYKEMAQPNFKNPKAWLLLLGSIVLLFIGFKVIFYAMFLVEDRPGPILFDPVHYFLPAPINFSNQIFISTYSAVFVIAMDSLSKGPNQLSKVCLGYTMILFLRSASMVLVPLDPPEGLILLIDPLISFFNPEPFVATRDLFFSGHCASLAFFFFIVKNKYAKYFLAFLNVFVIIAISLQRVHYTIDIVGGVIVAYGVYRLIEKVFVTYVDPFFQKEKQSIPSVTFSKKDSTKGFS